MERRKNANLCLTCGKELDREGAYCSECLKRHNRENSDRRKWYQQSGICPRCCKNRLYGDEKVCLECSAYTYTIAMRSRERLGKEHCNKVHREWAKAEHQRRLDNGLCTRCGKRKADGGFKTCGICREKDSAARRARTGTKPDRSERYKQGLCYFCDNPVKDGYKVCEKHYDMNIQKLDNEKTREYTKKLKKIISGHFTKKGRNTT